MKLFWLTFLLTSLGGRLLAGDVISQTNAQGDEVILQRDAIVTSTDSSFVVYKHFDLKEHRITVIRLSRGSLPVQVKASDEAGRARIVNVWKRFGFKASITDQAGKKTQVYDLFLDFYPPGGRGSLLESLPALTDFPILIDGGGSNEIEFADISRVDIRGDRLSIVLRDDRTVSGKFLLPTDQPAEVRVLGITDNYDPTSDKPFDFSVPLSQLKAITFQ